MRILQVVHGFLPYSIAGTEVYTFNLSRELSKNNEIFIFHRINQPGLAELEILRQQYKGLDIIAINNTFRKSRSFEMTYKNEGITREFSLLLDEIRPDIVHLQHLLFLSTSMLEEIHRRRIPVVMTLHDYWLICHQGQLFNKKNETCPGPSTERCRACLKYLLSIRKGVMGHYSRLRGCLPPRLLLWVKNIYFAAARLSFLKTGVMDGAVNLRIRQTREALGMVDAFISPSYFLRNKFIEFGLPHKKIKVLPYGFNPSLVMGRKRKQDNITRIVFIGTLLPAKGVDILIKAFNRLDSENSELRIYGKLNSYKGFEYYTSYLRKLSRNERIRFMGEFDNAQIGGILNEADVLAVPSIWQENSPLVIQEAQLAGVPVIASRIGGIPELITHRKNGLLFNPGDVGGLYGQLKLFIHNPGLAQYLKRNIKRPMSIEENARAIERIYSNAHG